MGVHTDGAYVSVCVFIYMYVCVYEYVCIFMYVCVCGGMQACCIVYDFDSPDFARDKELKKQALVEIVE